MSAICIGCGCDDDHACEGGCSWLRIDPEQGAGVCSSCTQHVARWDDGDQDFEDVAMDAVADRAELEQATTDPGLILPGDADFSETLRYMRSR